MVTLNIMYILSGNDLIFYPVYKYVDSGMQYYYFYMNWGWYGGYNGSYLDTAKDPVYGEEITDRRDIYGIEPNN